jgi:alkylation response protein AidB-like acyl-CoA dehydrogenase
MTWTTTPAEAGTQRMVRDRRGDLLAGIGRGAADRDEACVPVPAGFLAAAGRAGLLSPALPRAAGGESAGPLTWARVLEHAGYLCKDTGFPRMTGGALADVFLTDARTEAGDMAAFLVHREDPGVSVIPRTPLGTRTSGPAALSLHDVPIPGGRIVAGTDGLTHARRLLNARRRTVCCAPAGPARTLVELTATRLTPAIRYGEPLMLMPNVQAAVA